MRILPPTQISQFIFDFDATLRQGFEQILGTPIDNPRWELAKVPPKYGGMGWKIGPYTFGAHYIASLTKESDRVCSIAHSHNTLRIDQQDASEWLRKIAPTTISIQSLVNSIRNPLKNPTEPNLSKPTCQQRNSVTSGTGRHCYPNLTTKSYSTPSLTPVLLIGGLRAHPLRIKTGASPPIS